MFDLTLERTDAPGDERYSPEAGRYRPDGEGPALLLRLGRRGRRARCWSASTATSSRARGSCAGRFAPGGLLAQERGASAWVTAHSNLQGAVALDGRMLMAESRGARLPGTLYASPVRGDARTKRRWAVGGEDLAIVGGEIFSLTEHPDFPRPLPRRRTVFRSRSARPSADRDDLQPALAARGGHDRGRRRCA